MLLKFLFSLVLLPIVMSSEHEHYKTPLTAISPVAVVQSRFSNSLHLEKGFLKSIRKLKKAFTNPSTHLQAPPFNDTPCYKAITNLGADLTTGSEYALKALDSWGKPESGFLQGNTKWVGRYKECLAATNSTKGNLFSPKYCSAYVGTTTMPQRPFGMLGACFPDVCNATEINGLIYTIIPKPFYAAFTCPPVSFTKWEKRDIAALFFSSLLLLFVAVSTSFDLILRLRKYQKIQYESFKEEEIEEESKTMKPPSRLTRACLSFSLIENTKVLLDTTQKPGQIHCLHGIRFFSMCWVVLGHSQLFAMNVVDNEKYFFDWTFSHWGHQVVVNGTFSVDTFFFLSGLLVAYLGMREIERRRGYLNPFLMYFLRFMRLTPAYAFIIMISITLWMKVGEGPYFYGAAQAMQQSCSKYWWTNLLYINNMYPSSMGDECYGVGWYLANDMQFYLLAPLLLFLLYKLPVVGKGCISALIVSSVLVTGLASNITKQQPMVIVLSQSTHAAMQISTSNGLQAQDSVNATLDDPPKKYSDFLQDLYAKPYYRVGAYLIGFITGYLLHKHRQERIRIPKLVVAAGWIINTAMCAAIIFGLYPTYKGEDGLTVNVAAFYNAVSRPLWCVGMAWIVITCVNGYGGPVNGLLSWKVFMPLSKLTYNSYLVHPLILYITYYSVERPIHASMYQMIVLYIGQLVLTHLFAYILAMVVEAPFGTLVKLMTESLRPAAPPREKKSPTQNGSAPLDGNTEIYTTIGNGGGSSEA